MIKKERERKEKCRKFSYISPKECFQLLRLTFILFYFIFSSSFDFITSLIIKKNLGKRKKKGWRFMLLDSNTIWIWQQRLIGPEKMSLSVWSNVALAKRDRFSLIRNTLFSSNAMEDSKTGENDGGDRDKVFFLFILLIFLISNYS